MTVRAKGGTLYLYNIAMIPISDGMRKTQCLKTEIHVTIRKVPLCYQPTLHRQLNHVIGASDIGIQEMAIMGLPRGRKQLPEQKPPASLSRNIFVLKCRLFSIPSLFALRAQHGSSPEYACRAHYRNLSTIRTLRQKSPCNRIRYDLRSSASVSHFSSIIL